MNRTPAEFNNRLVISYLTLRKTVGVLAILLPFTVSIGAYLIFKTPLQDSISGYYYTATRNFYVGTMWALGFFFFSYKGYDWHDELAGNLACVFAVGASLFPTAPLCPGCVYNRPISNTHVVFATLLFLTLIYFSLVLFPKTDPTKTPTPQKLKRNRLYRICGYTMLVSITLVIPIKMPHGLDSLLHKYVPVFWLEGVAILAFGVSWLTKGEGILSDEN